MNMTAQQRKTLWVSVIVIVGLYITRSIIDSVMADVNYHQWALQAAARQATQGLRKTEPKAPPKAPTKVAAAVPPSVAKQASATVPIVPAAAPAIPSEFSKLVGIWRGHVALIGRGECDLRFELRPKQDPGKFVGYSSFTCVAAGPLIAKANNGTAILNRTNPEAAILSGAIEKGSLRFTVDKVVGADSNGCSPSSFALTPFGVDRLAADWEEPNCSGGHLVLARVIR